MASLRRRFGFRPRPAAALSIVDLFDASYVIFTGWNQDVNRVGVYTCLRFHPPLHGRIDLANIHVEEQLRGQGVAERLVRAVSDAYPGVPMSFSAMNPHSRRLARKLADRIPLFDPDVAAQERNRAADEAAGFYDEISPRARSDAEEIAAALAAGDPGPVGGS